jgi:O-acetyl-ADP-ribose deacetylase (regulator of RNase III)
MKNENEIVSTMNPNFMKLARNSKGGYAWEIKKYFGTEFKAALAEIERINKELNRKFSENNED